MRSGAGECSAASAKQTSNPVARRLVYLSRIRFHVDVFIAIGRDVPLLYLCAAALSDSAFARTTGVIRSAPIRLAIRLRLVSQISLE